MTFYYAVKVGRKTGIFDNITEACKQVDGFSCSEMRKFNNLNDAHEYLNGSYKRYYVVINGNYPGIYTDKSLAYRQVAGYSNGILSVFKDIKEARHYLLSNFMHIAKLKLSSLVPRHFANNQMYYLVVRGRTPGIYLKHKTADQQVNEYPNGYLKSFKSFDKLKRFAKAKTPELWNNFIKSLHCDKLYYYVVIKGRYPGIYLNKKDADNQICNYANGYARKFNSWLTAACFILKHQLFSLEPTLDTITPNTHKSKPNLQKANISKADEKIAYYAFRAGKYSKVFTNEQDLFNALEKHPNGWSQRFYDLNKATKFISNYNPSRSKFVNFKATVYTDGGFAHNQTQHGSWAYLINIKYHRNRIYDSGSLFKVRSGNNYMELYALREALKELIKLNYNRKPIHFILDSQYVLFAIINNDYKYNSDDNATTLLWNDVRHLLKQFKNICFDWTKGHAGNVGNEFVDDQASQELKLISLSQIANIS